MRRGIPAILIAAFGFALPAAEPPARFFTCPVDQLEILEGKLIAPRYGNLPVHGDAVDVLPDSSAKRPLQVRLDGPGAVELVVESASGRVDWKHVFLAVRSDGRGAVTGSFVYWKGDQKQTVKWRLPAGANTTRAADWFNYGRAARLDRTARQQIAEGIPGQAWFRHTLDEVAGLKTKELAPLWLSKPTDRPIWDTNPEPNEPRAGWVLPLSPGDGGPARPFMGDREDFLQLVSGGRAVSENLQLKRELNIRGNQPLPATIKVSELKGIEVKEYDWAPHIVGLRPRIDPLAAFVPADQHAVFFPDVPAAVAVLDELDRTGLAATNLAEARGTDNRLADRYLKQLGLPSAQLGKLLPASLIDNVAITGSDLYFDTGTDMAVLLSTSKPGVVRQLLTAAWPVLKATTPDAAEKEEIIAGTTCRVLRTPDRRICCYVAAIGDAVLLTNSPAQIQRIASTKSGKSPSLAGSPEYTFFRERYRRGESGESGFVILTDAAIRRWCSPVWRIGHQRRIQTGAYLADAQATHLKSMHAAARPRQIDDPRLGPIEVGPHGVHSATHGSWLFQTPIAEVEIDMVTTAEADAYRRWRDTYQQNWSQFFDPIAIQISARPEKLAVDMTVIPLILATDYRELTGLTTGARLPPGAGDPHPEALAQFVMGFNRKSDTFAKTISRYEGIIGQQFEIAGWIGDWLTVYGDEDPVWDEFLKSELTESEFWEKRRWQIPIGIGISVVDSKKHAQFVKKFRELIHTFIPLESADITYKGVAYTRLQQKGPQNGPIVWSLALPDQWVISLNEAVVRRAIDRHLAVKDGRAAKPAWLGDSLGFTTKPRAAYYLREWWGRSGLTSVRQAAWANIPILNEWRQFNRVNDPVEFHERWWGERLLEPAGGKYVWNAEDRTMESTVFGHPGRPKGTRATLPAAVAGLRGADFGITFERDGLRARFELAR